MSTVAGPDDTQAYTVDEVADLTGTSVRTIRWYQSEGLVPPPQRDGRVARYGAGHVTRLEVIRDLQAHGLTLVAIRRLLDHAPDGAAATALAFVEAAVSHGVDDADEAISAAEGAARLGTRPTPEAVEALSEMGIIEPLPDGRWRIVSPTLFGAAEELASWGVPEGRRLAIAVALRDHADAMAQAFVELFVKHVWRPSDRGDAPDWTTLTHALARLRPLATASVVAMFDQAMARAAEAAMERELENSARARRRGR